MNRGHTSILYVKNMYQMIVKYISYYAALSNNYSHVENHENI